MKNHHQVLTLLQSFVTETSQNDLSPSDMRTISLSKLRTKSIDHGSLQDVLDIREPKSCAINFVWAADKVLVTD